ncbi:tetratricopeptide repeat protein [Sulfuriflexus mobilis]|uniref:tetratricopeptide repeat protein n=1 Tax=Sulfuriflexus mobilis TaxID=1811807 RepID=UPI000F824A1F|nr:tetratricopeptide repeat protein [Sulfuriflexus mobilis]
MKKIIAISILLFAAVVEADTSDYIWNQQFEKKLALAQQGDMKAQYDIGNMYLKGQGTARDAKEAFNWFGKAAEQGYSRAEYKLGYLYQRGNGVTKDQDKAYHWLRKSADKGYTPAMFYLGKLYVSRGDYEKALIWYTRADENAYHPAKDEIPKVKAKIAKLQAQRSPVSVVKPPPAAKPVPVAKPAPAAVVKQAPAPAAAAKTASKQARYARAMVSTGSWKLGGKPADVLPSDSNVCQSQGNKIVCQSDELEVEEKYGVVSYKLNTEITDFNNEGEFNIEYQKNVTLIFPSDPDNPDLVIPINYGLQAKQLMRCKVIKNDITCYRGKTRERVTYIRS